MQKWLDSPFGAQPPLSSAGDLLALLPRYRPTNYRLQKVKSHQDLAAVPLDELLPAIGNHVADVAAKGAEAADMPGLSEQLTAVANWYDEQEANLFTFFQYQLELTKAVGNLTNAAAHATADNQSGIADDNEILGQWCALQDSSQQFSGPPPGPADAMSRISRQTTWPPEFLQSLYAWCQQLQWPAAETSASPHTLAGITYLELFTNFVVCTGRLPPQQVKHGTRVSWLELTDSGGILLPVVLRDVILAFLAATKFLDKLIGVRCWPSQRHHRLHCLRVFGCRDGRKGLLLRPQLSSLSQTGELVAKLATNGCGEVLRDFALQWRQPS